MPLKLLKAGISTICSISLLLVYSIISILL